MPRCGPSRAVLQAQKERDTLQQQVEQLRREVAQLQEEREQLQAQLGKEGQEGEAQGGEEKGRPAAAAGAQQGQQQEQGKLVGRVAELEARLAEAQGAQGEREQLARRAGDAEVARDAAQHELAELLVEAQEGLYLDSLTLRSYLAANVTALEAAWAAGLAAAAPRGVVVSAGGGVASANAFATLHVLRHHLGCSLPAALM